MVGHVHPVSCHHGTTQTSVRSAIQTSGREIGEGRRQEFVVVGGDITMYNNPAFQAFLMATVAPYKMEWPSGEDRPLLSCRSVPGSAPRRILTLNRAK